MIATKTNNPAIAGTKYKSATDVGGCVGSVVVVSDSFTQKKINPNLAYWYWLAEQAFSEVITFKIGLIYLLRHAVL
jgi:hypothetical protein